MVTKVQPNTNSVEVHPQLSTIRHPMDGAVVGAGSLWPTPIRELDILVPLLGYNRRLSFLHCCAFFSLSISSFVCV
jgi:hypothetical protein